MKTLIYNYRGLVLLSLMPWAFLAGYALSKLEQSAKPPQYGKHLPPHAQAVLDLNLANILTRDAKEKLNEEASN